MYQGTFSLDATTATFTAPFEPSVLATLRENMALYGPQRLSDRELFAVATGSNLDRAASELARTNDLRVYARMEVDELARRLDIPTDAACVIAAAIQLGIRAASVADLDTVQVTAPHTIASMCADMTVLDHEVLRVFVLNTKNHVIAQRDVFSGTINSSLVRVAEVFRDAVKLGGNAIAIAHNHPSGDTTPSSADVKVTSDLVAAGKLFDIEVVDHVIVGAGRYVSLREKGLFSR